MALAGELPPDASTASTGLRLNYIGEHAYGYSGDITPAGAADPDTVMLDFISGSGYIVGSLSWNCDNSTTPDEFYQFELNGEIIYFARYASAADASNDQPYDLILPPFSHLVVKMGNTGSSKMTATFTGRVYDA